MNVSLRELQAARAHLSALLRPADTVMDLNIGAALWFGSRGVGSLIRRSAGNASSSNVCRYASQAAAFDGEGAISDAAMPSGEALPPLVSARINVTLTAPRSSDVGVRFTITPITHCTNAERAKHADDACEDHDHNERSRFRSSARILLVGSGADELLAGYGRHKTVFTKEGWRGLANELKAERERYATRCLLSLSTNEAAGVYPTRYLDSSHDPAMLRVVMQVVAAQLGARRPDHQRLGARSASSLPR